MYRSKESQDQPLINGPGNCSFCIDEFTAYTGFKHDNDNEPEKFGATFLKCNYRRIEIKRHIATVRPGPA